LDDWEQCQKQLRVLHVITDLGTGGAERMLAKLLNGCQQGDVEHHVVNLTAGGSLGEEVKKYAASVTELGMRPGTLPLPNVIARLWRAVRSIRPAIIQGWMYHGNFAATCASFMSYPRPALAWNIRASLYRSQDDKIMTRAVIFLGSLLSRDPDAIVYVAHSSAAQHHSARYCNSNAHIIPNGFDLEQYKPNDMARQRIRNILNISSNTVLIGHVARWHPMKDHKNLLLAVRHLLDLGANFHVAMIGPGIEADNLALVHLIDEQRVSSAITLLGERQDIVEITPGFDIACLSSSDFSLSEAFPNVLGEALASAVPCVTTDVGDARFIVAEGGLVVPPSNSRALAEALLTLIKGGGELRRDIGRRGREQVACHFSLSAVCTAYEKLYKALSLRRRGMT